MPVAIYSTLGYALRDCKKMAKLGKEMPGRDRDHIEIGAFEARRVKAIVHALEREPREVLYTAEALLSHVCHDLAVHHQGGSTVVPDVNTEYIHAVQLILEALERRNDTSIISVW